jgi:histone-lysine N-methyltransferase SETMAR
VQKSTGKVLGSIFWDQDGILIEYLPKGQTINTEYYSSLLVQFKIILKEKRRGKIAKGILFLHNNALAHLVLATQKKLGFLCLNHPPYSSNVAPSDYHLFPGLRKQLKGRHISSDLEVIVAVGTWLDGGLQKLQQPAKKCIGLCGECVEYIPSLVAAACFFPGQAKVYQHSLICVILDLQLETSYQ